MTIQVTEGFLSFQPASRKEAHLCHEALVDSRVLLLLPRIDDDLAARVRDAGLPAVRRSPPVAVGAHEPVGKVHGATQPTSDPVAVLAKANEVLAAFAARLKLKAGTNSIEIVVRGKPRKVVIDTKAPDKGVNSPTATYETLSSGDIKITLSDRIAPHHIERALAHELAEIRFVLEGGQSAGANALDPKATTTTLSAHDVGRLPEIDVMARQLDAAEAAGDAATVKRLREEGIELVKHLGLTGLGGDARQRLMDLHSRSSGDPLIGKALEQIKRIVRDPTYSAIRPNPKPGGKSDVPKITDPFERKRVADAIANGHAHEKHVEEGQQFKIREGDVYRRMTAAELSALVESILESPTVQSKVATGDPRRVYFDGKNTLIFHNPKARDQGTIFKAGDAASKYQKS